MAKKKTRRAQGEGALYKRADGMWIGAVSIPTEDGRRKRLTVSSTDYGTAVKKHRELIKRIDSGDIPVVGKTTVEKWCTKWLEEIRGPNVDPATYTFYEKAVRLYIVPEIGTKRLDLLTPQHVRTMTANVTTRVSTRAAQNAWRVLRMALKDAIKEGGLISRNVVEATHKPAHVQKEGRSLTFEEAKRVINLASSGDLVFAARVAAAFCTGARPAELLGAKWDCTDLDAGDIRLEWQLQRLSKEHGCGGTCGRAKPSWCRDADGTSKARWKVPAGFDMKPCHGSLAFTRPKTLSGVRVVPLIEPLRLLLVDLKTVDGKNPHGLIFHHPDGRPISPEEDWKAWSQLLADAGIDGATRYAARHTTATLLQGFGVDEETRMAIMGQSAIAAHRAYIHVGHQHTRLALTQLDQLLEPTPSAISGIAGSKR